ncbi:MAG: bifunctional phosphoribosylaminoimidazolecarboxamide formyltransferase/IMP cyclohydrolase [Gemmatimonadales bacterium]|nr:bifunctional phosphoribosylaminoimidazolecarboxamide formyltransferase/IMP cyclohydrolase [Gemmatimonadales bacterium]MYG47763.1 bifunctional phosphoribosylaminoimidazolecarboxamide formyltransferase/IMP cyclohydrolase [Gemmatimonadales bacterium]MYK02655.1 bifunctional phosphoribosylaminoimidazolecarboxamide formyltransferase/IMP cyclohydrolase [Candidatus Palauibacter ramosifaciens]
MPTALVSVSDKTGIEEFCAGLIAHGWEIASTGGTMRALRAAGIEVRGVSDLTGHPEMLGGRVKTLHPRVHGGILARREVPDDLAQLAAHGMIPIDLVAVNLYPFRETVADGNVALREALEQIDIGGPTMLRASAKNHPSVWSVCDPADYGRVLEAIDAGDAPETVELRRELAVKVFAHTAAYDAAIVRYLGEQDGPGSSPDLPAAETVLSLVRVQPLRYGENPDQQAAFFRDGSGAPRGIPALAQLHGRELSFNNILDVDGALTAIAPFVSGDRAACAILKHSTPCGLAVGPSPLAAYEKALACDPVSAFGSVIAFTDPLTEAVAEALSRNFVECVVAPGYSEDALRLLQEKKNIRILQPEAGAALDAGGHLREGVEVRGVRGGVLMQAAPRPAREVNREARVPTARVPSEAEWDDLAFAWSAVQSVKSNAILLARNGASIGIGAGQMSRVDSVEISIRKARAQGFDVAGAVLGSDAFFPFRDGIDAAAAAGVTAIAQPGGSKRDAEVVEAANEHGMAMVFTDRRLFRH